MPQQIERRYDDRVLVVKFC